LDLFSDPAVVCQWLYIYLSFNKIREIFQITEKSLLYVILKINSDSSVLISFCFFLWDWSLKSGLCACKAGAVLLELCLYPFCSGYFGDGIS
jgi:hypothetical protein